MQVLAHRSTRGTNQTQSHDGILTNKEREGNTVPPLRHAVVNVAPGNLASYHFRASLVALDQVRPSSYPLKIAAPDAALSTIYQHESEQQHVQQSHQAFPASGQQNGMQQ
ncbi:hypothetical protein S40285_09863 [Stachybotrys chlorohalonatus IBT 40285]|uniref:Uncharacterized protein n=1 Tax=Stachybotrys chlorohalonatus (strain IBT 40285) TaxID=1283841 RepID=A0A084QJU6_STAC4|nr:hypothetical protein S40285_09863 [Stachybotrys chlorohalonata IBT 40285]